MSISKVGGGSLGGGWGRRTREEAEGNGDESVVNSGNGDESEVNGGAGFNQSKSAASEMSAGGVGDGEGACRGSG